MSKAEDAMEQQRYDQALASIDSALVQDSANAQAYLLKAEVLRQRADSTMAPDAYKELYQRAREAEEKAIQFDPGVRGEVKTQRTLAYSQQSQRGAKAFQRGRQGADPMAYRQAAAHFGAASVTYPDSAEIILNEAYARLNQAQNEEEGSMTTSIPVLERYIEVASAPDKNAYDILSALYLQDDQAENAIELLETARVDLRERPTHFRIAGTRGLNYSGTVETSGGSRSVEGTTPGRVMLDTDEGSVSGTFTKEQEQGQLQARLFFQGDVVKDTTITTGKAVLSVNLDQQSPLAQIEGRLLNAYNQAGQTEKAMAEYRQQIERNPNNVTYRYNYGSMLLQADRYDAAIEQLEKAVELEPGNVKAQYNLGAAYSNKARRVQDSLVTLNDSLRAISEKAMKNNREPTEEEKQAVDDLDAKTKELTKQKRALFQEAIPPLERARQMSGPDGSFRQDACRALVTAYVQTERLDQAKQYEDCAGLQVEQRQGNDN